MEMAIHEERRLRVLENLIKITLSNCSECKEIPAFGHLPRLKHLTLENLGSVRSIGPSFCGIVNDSSSTCSEKVFPALESLELNELPKLTEWVEVPLTETQRCGLQIFPRLEHLDVRDCPRLITAPSHFPCLRYLCIERVYNELLLGTITSSTTSLSHLYIWNMSNLTFLPDKLLYNNQDIETLSIRYCPNLDNSQHLQRSGTSLKNLEVWGCQQLRELPADLHNLQSLEDLVIFGCPNLKSVKISRGMTSLQRLSVTDCSYVEFSVHISEMKLLISLTLHSCGELKGIEFLANLREMKSLQYLTIWNCGELNSCPEGIEELSRLWELSIGPFADSVDLSDFLIGIGSLQSLIRLRLYGSPLWESLPDQLQNLTCLKKLTLKGFGVEALPEWLGKLSSLELLRLEDFAKLKKFPTKQFMQRFTRLYELFVDDCPLWKDRLLRFDDHYSEWSKISDHARLIWIDGTLYSEDNIKKLHNFAPKVGCINLCC